MVSSLCSRLRASAITVAAVAAVWSGSAQALTPSQIALSPGVAALVQGPVHLAGFYAYRYRKLPIDRRYRALRWYHVPYWRWPYWGYGRGPSLEPYYAWPYAAPYPYAGRPRPPFPYDGRDPRIWSNYGHRSW